MIHSMNRIRNDKSLELVSRYCDGKSNNLKELEFCEVHLTKKDFFKNFRNVFKNLTKLSFRGTAFDTDLSDFFPLSTELEDLHFWPMPPTSDLLNDLLISNPKLTKLYVRIDSPFSDEEEFAIYLTQFDQLN